MDHTPLCLTDVRDGRDWLVDVHKDLHKWLLAHVTSDHVRNEVLIAYQSFLKSGYFAIHTGRFQSSFGGQASKQLKQVLRDCPLIQLRSESQLGKKCRTYAFTLRGLYQLVAQSTDSTSESLVRCVRVRNGYSSRYVMDGSWLRLRCARWAMWCEKQGLPLKLDLFGLTRLAKATFDSLKRISIPKSLAFTPNIDAKPRNQASNAVSKHEHAWLTHRRLLSGRVMRAFLHKDGRSYNPITNVSKVIRRQMQIDGERLQEADLACSFWYLLATELPDGPEKERLVEVIHAGCFYEAVADAADQVYADRCSLKIECQRQLLFAHDWRESSRPLWKGLRKLFPGLCRLIEKHRSQLGVSEFAKHLMRLEGLLMDTVHYRLIELGIHAIRLHDGMLVGASKVTTAASVIEEAGERLFGIKPATKAK